MVSYMVPMNARCFQLLQKARNNPTGLRFAELRRLCRCAGMTLDRTHGSHFIYRLERPFFFYQFRKRKTAERKLIR
jgi:hypothetical protein